jgi:hypothetical protein
VLTPRAIHRGKTRGSIRRRHPGRGSNPVPLRSGAGSGPLRRTGDHAHAAGRPSRQPGRSVGLPAQLATAPCVLHRLVTICGKDPTRPRYRVKARYAGPGGSAMEGTSGAADLEPLRGGSGEAALDPRRSAKAGRGVTWSRSSLAFTCEGHGSRGVIVGGIPYQLVSDSFRGSGSRQPRCTGLSLRCAPIMRQEVSERIGLGRSSRRGPLSGGTSGTCVAYACPARREAPGGESRPAPGP